jgi:hypothetical protein
MYIFQLSHGVSIPFRGLMNAGCQLIITPRNFVFVPSIEVLIYVWLFALLDTQLNIDCVTDVLMCGGEQC